MIDAVCTLIGEGETTLDKYLNENTTETEREVFCQVSGVVRNEFYQAATAGLRPEWTIRLSDFAEYQGEKKVRYDGEVFSVLRTYRDDGSFHRGTGMRPNELELIIGHKIGTAERGGSE